MELCDKTDMLMVRANERAKQVYDGNFAAYVALREHFATEIATLKKKWIDSQLSAAELERFEFLFKKQLPQRYVVELGCDERELLDQWKLSAHGIKGNGKEPRRGWQDIYKIKI